MAESADIIEEALEIKCAESNQLMLDDFRRLTGPGLLWGYPGAILDVFQEGFDPKTISDAWHRHARIVLDAIGWQNEQIIHRVFDGGLNLAISAQMDQLYSAMFTAQTAWHFCAAELLGVEPNDFDQMISDLKSVMVREKNPALIDLLKAAHQHQLFTLSDDDNLSIGHGKGSKTWNVFKLPTLDQVPWSDLKNAPIALITGTNGKTTSTRLCAAIAAAAGLCAGLSSTDFVRVGDDILDYGDYSGPGGARMVLRDPRLDVAFLEVARGGILRRGLPLRGAKAALVTNVAADHLGQYGVNTVEDLAQAKFAVHRGLANDGVLVVNADDPLSCLEAEKNQCTKCWISLNVDAAQIERARKQGESCAWLEGSDVYYFDGNSKHLVLNVADIPLTMNGAARHNILNALGAICVCSAMNIDMQFIREGLCNFSSSLEDNPGRCNEFSAKGARLFVDFAHNPHSIAAMAQTMASIPAKRRYIMLSHAGDRSDKDIRDVTETALAFKPDLIIAAELENYLRGRELGDIPALIVKSALAKGMNSDQVIKKSSPLQGVKHIVSKLEEGDLALLLVLSDRDQVFDYLKEISST